MPFVHLHINENDQIKPCCYGDPIKQYDNSFNYITDPDMNQIRSAMLEGHPVSQCENCYKIERNGGESFRQRNNNEWNFVSTPNLVYYDIRNDNTCNLLCRMCHPGASSQIDKEYKKLGWYWPDSSRKNKLTDIVNINTIENLFVAGGEPTLMPEFATFLERAIEKKRTDIKLRISTNATNINKKILELLKKFNNIEFTVSIDGYNQVNKYIRWPSDWDSITDNIHKLYKITSNISFNVTVSIWNIYNLSKLINYLESTYPPPTTIFLNEAISVNNNNISPFNYPDKQSALEDLVKMKQSISYQKEEFFKNKLDYFIRGVETTEFISNNLKQFFIFNDALDHSRKIKLKDYLPELEECRIYC